MRLRVTELGRGVWRAYIEGEEETVVTERSPDQALAGLIRANLRRFGIEAMTYEAEVAPTNGSGVDPTGPSRVSHGSTFNSTPGSTDHVETQAREERS